MITMAWFMNTDWEQYKKNLENERKAWKEFENIRENLKTEIAKHIERLRVLKETEEKRLEDEFQKEKEQLEEELKKKIKKAHDKYMKKMEKKFKPDIEI